MANPVNNKDINGLWSEAVHNEIIREADLQDFSEFGVNVDALIESSVFVDKDQGGEGAYKHAMRTSDQTVEEAASLSANWVHVTSARFVTGTGDSWDLGLALHTVADAECPSHKGFQIWDGPIRQILNPKESVILHTIGDFKIWNEAEFQRAVLFVRLFVTVKVVEKQVRQIEQTEKLEQLQNDFPEPF